MREQVRWHGAYKGTFDLWTADAYAHPAKMAPGLAFRILDHLEARGLLHPGDTVLDFMAGVGTTLLAAAAKGYRAIGIELEPRFVEFAQANVAHLSRKMGRELDVTIIEGDARHMDELLSERGLIGLVSPPYLGETVHEPSNKRFTKDSFAKPEQVGNHSQAEHMTSYGGSTGQIGNLPDKPRTIGISSPPYADSAPEAESGSIDRQKNYATYLKAGGGSSFEKFVASREKHEEGYGSAQGQIGALPDRPRIAAITSPPYGDTFGDWKNRDAAGAVYDGAGARHEFWYGAGAQNIGNLPESLDPAQQPKADWWRRKALGEANETYLEAMAQIYAAASRVCDVLVTVTKNPTRNGELRRLDKDTLALIREAGFTPVCYHQSMLFTIEERKDLFGETTRKPRGRMGFFKRLQWQKGAPGADHEDVLVAVLP